MRLPTVAVTVPLPSTRPALNVAVPPRPPTKVASVVGSTLHEMFADVAVSECVRRRARERELASRPHLT